MIIWRPTWKKCDFSVFTGERHLCVLSFRSAACASASVKAVFWIDLETLHAAEKAAGREMYFPGLLACYCSLEKKKF